MILAVGYRIRSHRGTQFRRWATERLSEYVVKGFVLDDERLKEGRTLGADYFDELLERIREIRASEKRFYQKIRDLYALSVDYDSSTAVKDVCGRPLAARSKPPSMLWLRGSVARRCRK